MATQKATTNTEQTTAVQHDAKADSASSAQASTHTETKLLADDQVEIITEIYDTTQPVDPATGTPPLKERTTQTRRRIEQTRQTVDTEQAVLTASTTENTTVIQDETHTRQETDTAVEATEKKGLNWLQRTLCVVGLLALLYIGIRLLLTYFKPF